MNGRAEEFIEIYGHYLSDFLKEKMLEHFSEKSDLEKFFNKEGEHLPTWVQEKMEKSIIRRNRT